MNLLGVLVVRGLALPHVQVFKALLILQSSLQCHSPASTAFDPTPFEASPPSSLPN